MKNYLRFWYNEEDEKKHGYNLVKDHDGIWRKYTLSINIDYDFEMYDEESIIVHEGKLEDCEIRIVKDKTKKQSRQQKNNECFNEYDNFEDQKFDFESSIMANKSYNNWTKRKTIDDYKMLDLDCILEKLNYVSKQIDFALQADNKKDFMKLAKYYKILKQML